MQCTTTIPVLCLARTHLKYMCEKCSFHEYADPDWTPEGGLGNIPEDMDLSLVQQTEEHFTPITESVSTTGGSQGSNYSNQPA
ncbi:hypothetical protein E2C01_027419 [Portunus trituberculatus]|uniref:Uncharacterized protein n=1 Tax=Portunus trituberculatus TaxID=210409 RepID=A0A5B7ELH9_PORTR|nr:hypothetical protein [Portunus trituberculatus]